MMLRRLHPRGFSSEDVAQATVVDGGRDVPLAHFEKTEDSCWGRTEQTTLIFRHFLVPPRQERQRGRFTPMESVLRHEIVSALRRTFVVCKASS